MTIKHRIFKRAYKRKAIKITTAKKVYKKFNGIKTLTLYKPEVKEKTVKIVKRKRKVSKKNFYVKPYLLARLSARALRQEATLAKKDVGRFTNFAGPEGRERFKELRTFKPFLSPQVWNRMSVEEKQNHLKKRREFQKKGLIVRDRNNSGRLKVSRNIIKFRQRYSRPLLKLLRFTERREYLKSLIAIAKLVATKTIEDRSGKKRLIIEKPWMTPEARIAINLTALRNSTKVGKLKRLVAKKRLSGVTHLSLLPVNILEILKKQPHAKKNH